MKPLKKVQIRLKKASIWPQTSEREWQGRPLRISKRPPAADRFLCGCRRIPIGDWKMKVIRIGILPQEKIRERTLAIARGEMKPQPSDPKIWFTSMRSLAEVLSDDNRALLRVIHEQQPHSISSLATVTGRKISNLSRTLKTMSHYGFVEMRREKNFVRPVVESTDFIIHAG